MGIGRFLSYLIGKKSEFKELDFKDVLLAKVVLDIHRKKTSKKSLLIPLWGIHPVHRLDRPNAEESLNQRIQTLQKNEGALRNHETLTVDILKQYLPSVSGIKVVQTSPSDVIAFEGNGRVAALKAFFTQKPGPRVEVTVYGFRNQRKILRRLNRVRRANGFPEIKLSALG